MPYQLLNLNHPDEYRDHYNLVYCKGPIVTFDGIEVRFRKNNFLHLCYVDRSGKKGARSDFAQERAQRIEWIRDALLDDKTVLYFGWDTWKQRPMLDRRVALVTPHNYVVTIQHTAATTADIVTAFLMDADSVTKLKSNKQWDPGEVKINGK